MPHAGTPESFKVLIKELQALGLDIKVMDSNDNEVDLQEAFQNELELGLESEGYVDNSVQPTPSEDEEEKNKNEDFLDMLFEESLKDDDDDEPKETPTLDADDDMEELMGSKYSGSDLFDDSVEDEGEYPEKF